MACLPHWIKELTPEMIKKAELELNETPERQKEALEHLKQLINDEEGFSTLTDDAFLRRFLRAKKYDVKRAFKNLKQYYSLKAAYPEILNVLPSDIEPLLEKDVVFVTTKRGCGGEGVMILTLGKAEEDWSLTSEKIASVAFISADVTVDAEPSQICGSSMIFDLKGVSMKTLICLSSPKVLSLMAKGLQDGWPHRINGLHIVNEPAFFSYTYNILKPMLSSKMRKRVHFHGKNLQNLHKYFPVEILPEQLGGAAGKKDFQEFRTNVLEREKLIKKMNEFVYKGVKYSESFYQN
ncbi:alpha-tocopherol transfer protein-like [Caerostris extrusa]|uniref:Alpha-tocopherol transfer protein-like n=1 Tax=Caerostris extrusa TaxID=172846 RepID=A0AAV4TY50_CAEEX|nr:alpha-tocopherol transfer protein-like [Caerostris extrusa]